MTLRIIGDVHGKYKDYVKICQDAEQKGYFTVQIGDHGLSYEHFEHYKLSRNNHRFFAGNHENYYLYNDCPNAMGDYGHLIMGGVEFFFVRGAFSIDKSFRKEGIDWWPTEELSMESCYWALESYKNAKPDIMLSHDCPDEVKDFMVNNGIGILGKKIIKTRTGQLLQAMFEFHRPKLHIFGHWHKSLTVNIKGTKFICLNELEYIDI